MDKFVLLWDSYFKLWTKNALCARRVPPTGTLCGSLLSMCQRKKPYPLNLPSIQTQTMHLDPSILALTGHPGSLAITEWPGTLTGPHRKGIDSGWSILVRFSFRVHHRQQKRFNHSFFFIISADLFGTSREASPTQGSGRCNCCALQVFFLVCFHTGWSQYACPLPSSKVQKKKKNSLPPPHSPTTPPTLKAIILAHLSFPCSHP